MADQGQGILGPSVNQYKGPIKTGTYFMFSTDFQQLLPNRLINIKEPNCNTCLVVGSGDLKRRQISAGSWMGHLQLDLKQL